MTQSPPAETSRPRRRMTRADREAQLLEVAEQVFAEGGFKATSMDEIAERADISKPVLYDHFGSKDGLLAAVVMRIRIQMRAAIDSALASVTAPDEALWVGLRAYFAFIGEHLQSWSVLIAENSLTGPVAEEVELIRRNQADQIATLAVVQLPDQDMLRARIFAQAIIGACERLVLWQRVSEVPLSPDELATHLLDLVWVGFAANRRGERWAPPSR